MTQTRYVRQYRTKHGRENWALFERQDGRRVRVGTARTEPDYQAFLRDGSHRDMQILIRLARYVAR